MAADVQVAKLMEMGFNREDVLKALTSNNLNFESALGEQTVTQGTQSCGTSGSDSEAGKTCPRGVQVVVNANQDMSAGFRS